MGEIDATFVQPIDHRPKPAISEAEGIPVINLSPLMNASLDDQNPSLSSLISEVGDACENWGFFQVINHGIPMSKLRDFERVTNEFFSSPMEEKWKVRKDEENPMGYHETELTRNVRDWKEVFDFITKHHDDDHHHAPNTVVNRWPDNPSQFREVAEGYAREVEKLAFKLMEVIALSVGLPSKRFYEFFKDQNTSFIRLNHYPPCPSPHLALGVGRHKDAGGLTILAQDDVPGLQVRRKYDGEWVLVKPAPGALIINVGDMTQVWSNDKYESVEHRVIVNSDKDRISIVYFFNPAFDAMVKPLDELVDDPNPPRYIEFNWGEYFLARKNSNFKNLGVENLQISHFKITSGS